MNMPGKETLVILAGGKSRRMGRDKTFLPYKGTTFLEYLVRRAKDAFANIVISAGSAEHAEQIRKRLGTDRDLLIIADHYGGIGPMDGLLSVFEETQLQRFVTLAVDIPEADLQVLQALPKALEDPFRAVMFSMDGTCLEACAAAYSRSACSLMKESFRRGEYGLRKALGKDRIRVLEYPALRKLCPGISPEHLRQSFRNINTREEFRNLQQGHGSVPEILAPAGTEEAARAAVNAGCDAVYLGGELFGARAYAGNFDREALLRTIEHCHLYGIRVYMTVNTLLKEPETALLVPYMEPYYHAGLDGVIVQDTGVIRILREAYPALPLHGSTQMSVASSYGAEFLRRQGLTRVVPARELTLQEIREIRQQVDIELETFVHGAMCYAYSGKCLLSSFLGSRSGNRGRCAQPCRQMYEMENGVREYAMSMKDLCTLSLLPDLIDAGIHSFKIEGRMKNPSYVAATTSAYRKARDFCLQWKKEPDPSGRASYQELAGELTEQMLDIYNRGGFYTGYYIPEPPGTERSEKSLAMISRTRPNHEGVPVGRVERIEGPEIFVRLIRDVHPRDVLEIRPGEIELTASERKEAGELLCLKGRKLRQIRPGLRVYRTRNHELLLEIEQEILQKERKIAGKARVSARLGEPVRITITSEDQVTVTAEGGMTEPASGKPATAEILEEKMKKTGGTGVELEVECELDEQVFVPMSLFNELRRRAVEEYKEALCRRYRRD